MNTIIDAIGIEIVEVKKEKVTATMPVHGPTRQPYGLLHGGASVVLAETVASVGSMNLVDAKTEAAVGLEINANHIRSMRDGKVVAVGKPLHIGRTTHIWEINITDEATGKLVCVSRCTVAVIKK
ncbi:hotdog fold thioesterase [Oceanobacillus alkalisoli]|uniref:hotdog fold thioesterase n=1 Tax=Oceanobacillus alkalisoli TaxID=2925113 RepID=UPI001EF13C8E|nr:PaaI family thioesterase [Oceanobacillus alkalisoli]MCF3943923.1 PaaI family thioesterase [Oceanobacillus alkalisoli]MCG5104571.1 PaaI family thioesterase [Oceanobacillus alkalisoli]